jgi:hypothetical protein
LSFHSRYRMHDPERQVPGWVKLNRWVLCIIADDFKVETGCESYYLLGDPMTLSANHKIGSGVGYEHQWGSWRGLLGLLSKLKCWKCSKNDFGCGLCKWSSVLCKSLG